MAVEYCADDDDDLDTPEGPDEAAKETARVSAAGLAPDHPLAMLVRQNLGTAPRVMGGRRQSNLGDIHGSAFVRFARGDSCEQTARGEGHHHQSQLVQISLAPALRRKRVSNIPLQPLAPQRPSSAGLHKEGTEPTADMLQETPHQERSASRGSHRRSDYSASKAKPMGKEERMDVFKQSLSKWPQDREMARVAHLLALSDDWETQTRKKLFEVHKQTKFQLELVNVEELKEKRYTRVGHKVFMQNMKNSNKCWSNPDISREARKDKTAPEVCQLKKLSQKIYVKPPPAPPPPPPKPKVDASLAGILWRYGLRMLAFLARDEPGPSGPLEQGRLAPSGEDSLGADGDHSDETPAAGSGEAGGFHRDSCRATGQCPRDALLCA
eukprot:s638_g8.t1